MPSGLAIVILLVFVPVLSNDFVDWDDDMTLVSNPHFRGLGWSQLGWMLTATVGGHWIPLTWLTFALDYLVWAMNPIGYHLTSLMIHGAAAVVLYHVARRLIAAATGEPIETTAVGVGGAFAALAFAVHPLRVESVAWATERRDVLSGLFYLLAILAYLRWQTTTSGRFRWYGASVGFAACALLSKSLALSLPVALVIIDAYPLRRFTGVGGWWGAAARRLYLEKLPYILMTAVISVVALIAVAPVGNMASLQALGPGARLAMAAEALVFYAGKTLVPLHLSPLYELPAHVDPWAPTALAACVIVVAVTAAGVLLRHRVPALLAGWSVYLLTLLPVSGIFQSGPQLRADRYSYLACLGWAVVGGAAAAALVRAGARGQVASWLSRFGIVLLGGWLLAMATLTWRQVPVWRDAETLWRYAVEVAPSCGRCRFGLGLVLAAQKGQLEPAIEQFERGVAARPDLKGIRVNLSLALAKLGRWSEARAHLEGLAADHPGDPDIRRRLGAVLIEMGEAEKAAEQLQTALRLEPDRAEALGNLGIALATLGRAGEAMPLLTRAVALSPATPSFHAWLAYTRRTLGQGHPPAAP